MSKIIKLSLVMMLMITLILFWGEISIEDLTMVIEKDGITTSVEEIVEKLRFDMLNTVEEIDIKYYGDYDLIKGVVEDPVEYVCKLDEIYTSSDYDYLKYNFKRMRVSVKGIGKMLTIHYIFEYRETLEQTEQVNQVIKGVLEKLQVDSKKDYEKVRLIHDFIVENATYDLAFKKVTAYNNLIEHSSICQGYAALTYKMMTEAGIPCRIIEGVAGNETHTWNIVRIKNSWYNIDCTWDDPVAADNMPILSYDYFLKSEKDFKDHRRNTSYETKEFHKKYTISEESYYY